MNKLLLLGFASIVGISLVACLPDATVGVEGSEASTNIATSVERLKAHGEEIKDRARDIQATTTGKPQEQAKRIEVVGNKVGDEAKFLSRQNEKVAELIKENAKLREKLEAESLSLIQWVLGVTLSLSLLAIAGGLFLLLYAKEGIGGVVAIIGAVLACVAVLMLQYLFWVCVAGASVLGVGLIALAVLYFRTHGSLKQVVMGVQQEVKPFLDKFQKEEVAQRLNKSYSEATKKAVAKIKGVKK